MQMRCILLGSADRQRLGLQQLKQPIPDTPAAHARLMAGGVQ